MQFDIPFNNEDDENGIPDIPNMQGFLITPNGPVPINRNTLSNLFGGKSRIPCCTIFNGEFIIYSLNSNNDNLSHLLFECVKNPSHRKPSKHTLLDAYEYLNTTHFLNFMISQKYDKHIWVYEGINMQIQILNSEQESYSKLLIIIEPSECTDYILNYSVYDMHYETHCEQITAIAGIPIMAKIIKGKSFYTPISCFYISFALNSNSPINFENIHLSNFYDTVLGKFINEAANDFYSGCTESNGLREIGERLLRVNFDINYDKNIFNIRIICVPSIFINHYTKRAHKYLFTSKGHLISVNPVNDVEFNESHDLISFANKIFSNKHSQLITLDIVKQGFISEYCEDYYIYKAFDVLCTQERFLTNSNNRFINEPMYENQQRIFSKIAILHSKYPEVTSFWKPYEDVKISIDNCTMNILGFINFDTKLISGKKYSEILDSISNEISEIFEYRLEDFASQNIKVIVSYDTPEIFRVMIYQMIDDNKSTQSSNSNTKVKKKFKLFGGDRS